MTPAKLLFGLSLVLAAGADAQSFEVASIKLHQGLVTMSGGGVHGATFSETAVTLRNLIEGAYDLRTDQIAGGPSWMESDHYDIAGKAEGEGPLIKEQLPKMLQVCWRRAFNSRSIARPRPKLRSKC